jgi:hypothetical protein
MGNREEIVSERAVLILGGRKVEIGKGDGKGKETLSFKPEH